MQLIFDSKLECDIMEDIIIDYEESDNIKKKVKKEDIKLCISQIKSCIDSFRIDKSMDFIGPMRCEECSNTWTAVCSARSKKLRCPKCSKMNLINKEVKNGT